MNGYWFNINGITQKFHKKYIGIKKSIAILSTKVVPSQSSIANFIEYVHKTTNIVPSLKHITSFIEYIHAKCNVIPSPKYMTSMTEYIHNVIIKIVPSDKYTVTLNKFHEMRTKVIPSSRFTATLVEFIHERILRIIPSQSYTVTLDEPPVTFINGNAKSNVTWDVWWLGLQRNLFIYGYGSSAVDYTNLPLPSILSLSWEDWQIVLPKFKDYAKEVVKFEKVVTWLDDVVYKHDWIKLRQFRSYLTSISTADWSAFNAYMLALETLPLVYRILLGNIDVEV